MGAPNYTYTITNGTAADASQVMQNFNDILNGVTDGTDDLSISALTCAGAATLNGNVTLGNAAGDDITRSGSIAASIPMKTQYVVDLGTTTIGIKSIYFGSSDAAAKGTRLIGATVASDWTLTLPTGVPSTAGYVLSANASGVGSWVNKNNITITTKSAEDYTATAADELILYDMGAAIRTLTLPAAASHTNKVFRIKKTSDDFYALTIATNGTETIDGEDGTTINTRYETLTIVSDGSNWHTVTREIPSGLTTYTPSFVNLGAGSMSSTANYWREGRFLCVMFKSSKSGGAGSGTSNVTMNIPGSGVITIDNAVGATEVAFGVINTYSVESSATYNLAAVTYGSSTTLLFNDLGSNAVYQGDDFRADSIIGGIIKVPISGWRG
jgi:hypothetical protein